LGKQKNGKDIRNMQQKTVEIVYEISLRVCEVHLDTLLIYISGIEYEKSV
jgi:hypothetical protein